MKPINNLGLLLILTVIECYPLTVLAQTEEPLILAMQDPEFDAILARDMAELTVTSVSKRPQQKNDAAAAIYVITQEHLQRIGATSVPEALRVVPGLEVARADSHRWAVTSRGFNSVLASKLLVLIDGRTVYTPVFSGTYWDDQTPLLKDIERIEVIRGPGASLYGANAVNGIINIITKHTSQTQGNYASIGVGSEEKILETRRGGQISENEYYRVYAQYHTYDDTKAYEGNDNFNEWRQGRAGFRYDVEATEDSDYTIQGDIYGSRYQTQLVRFRPTAPFAVVERGEKSSHGGNILARWNHDLTHDSSLSFQSYIDYYDRAELHFDQRVATIDVQLQHDMALDDRNKFIWGAGINYNLQRLDSTFTNGVVDENENRMVYNLFAQDEYTLIPDELYATIGSKFEYNSYTGFEVQPNARLSWQPTDNQTLWAAVSRAVRTPSEIEDQAFAVVGVAAGTPPVSFAISGNPNLESEVLIAYELGYRIQPLSEVSFDIATFYNDYEKLGTIDTFGPPFLRNGALFTPLPFSNRGSGQTYGAEIAANWNITDSWRLNGSYSYLQINVDYDSPAIALVFDENPSPQHQFAIQSYYNISDTVTWDNMLYYVDGITLPADAYLRYDMRLAWQVDDGLELSLVGRNLLDNRHVEFPYYPQTEIERSILGMATWHF